jgi:hypothetical protein
MGDSSEKEKDNILDNNDNLIPANKKSKEVNKDKEDAEDSSIEEMTKEMPPQLKSMVMSFAQSYSKGTFGHPLFDKFNADHINKFLDGIQKDDNHAFELKRSNRIYHLIYTILGVGVLIFLIIYLLPVDKELLTDILKAIIVFAGGVGSGFGLKTRLDKKK